jgi:lysophospholipase L1-like esterase
MYSTRAHLRISIMSCMLGLGGLALPQAAEPIRVACIGNSITEGGYPQKLAALLGPSYKVENDGVSATTLLKRGDFPYWTRGKLANVFAFKPHIVTIKLGTNDTKAQNWDRFGGEFERDLNALIDTLNSLSSKPRIWLVAPIPIYQNTFGIRNDILTSQIIPIYKKVAAARSLELIDAYTPMLNQTGLYTDGVHMRPAGNDSIAAIFYRAFESKAVKIACIGNSITQYVNTVSGQTLPEQAYAARLGMLFGPGHFTRNYGVSGAYVQKNGPSPYWTNGRLAQIFAWKPQVITIKLGTNDARAQDWNRANFIKDLAAFIDTLENGISPRPKIWLTLPVPAWEVNGVKPFNGIDGVLIRDQVIPAIKEVAAAKGLPTIDAHTPFLDLKRLVPDGVHPINEGQDSLAVIFHRTMTAGPTSVARGSDRPSAADAGARARSAAATFFRWLDGFRGIDGRSRPR